MVPLKRYFSVALLISTFSIENIKAAEVGCGFITENMFSKSGEWLAQDDNWQKLLKMFPDGVSLSLETPLIQKLDSSKVFFAGEVKQGNVYLKGTQHGVEGKLIRVKGEHIFIYDGVCSVD